MSFAESLVVTSNDPDSPTNSIPAVMSVGVLPTIDHSPYQNTSVTSGTYDIDATITPAVFLNTNELNVYWNTNGSTASSPLSIT